MKWFRVVAFAAAAGAAAVLPAADAPRPFPCAVRLSPGKEVSCGQDVRNFFLSGKCRLSKGAEAALRFHSDDSGRGYEVLFRNGPVDGTRKTGSLSHVRNLYRSMARDEEDFSFEIKVREKNVEVSVNFMPVVRYTEGERPYRLPQYAKMLFSHGDFAFEGRSGSADFFDMVLEPVRDGVVNPDDLYPYADEAEDPVIRLQQEDFPVVNWHVHVKGGWKNRMAHWKSLADGINYGVSVNIYGKIVHKGDGGFGRMIETDDEALKYLSSMSGWPFMHGFQGEGRKWTASFSEKSLAACDFLFTDSMTIVDRNRQIRLYRPEEFTLNGRTAEEWMDFYVSQIEQILENEPADFYANPMFLPPELAKDADALWTDARIDRVLEKLVRHSIALEINSRYCIPGHRALRKAKARGIKFVFGTNNVDANIGRLEWSLEAVRACGIAKEDMWFPPDSARLSRRAVVYNTIEE
ncbi:MAG: hypothetical protein IKE55_08710 [Kiritimatiellae bacterium]|nr:hypothetical protein [Kiritimatiellia bacterium]